MNNQIRRATASDAVRIAEIIVFNYRMNFYPIFGNDDYYFSELNTADTAKEYSDENVINNVYVYDDGAVKGVIQLDGSEIKKLFVEPCLHGNGIGARLLEFAVKELEADNLMVLEKNSRAVKFYERHGFRLTDEKEFEEETTEYLIKMKR